jgi:hypothetical protein
MFGYGGTFSSVSGMKRKKENGNALISSILEPESYSKDC